MSRIGVESERLTVKTFASLQPLEIFGLPAIQQPLASDLALSERSNQSLASDDVPRAEGCLITGSIKYANQRAHWINAVRNDEDLALIIAEHIQDLRISPSQVPFDLDHPSNLAFLEPELHIDMDLYSLFAVTGTEATLRGLLSLVREDNNYRERFLNDDGTVVLRNIDFKADVFESPKFELLLLHPSHFLPNNQVLIRYHNRIAHSYTVAEDGILRRSQEPTSEAFPQLPAPQGRRLSHQLNPFFVIMNAEIKFRRFLRWLSEGNPDTLSQQAHELIRLTIDIVDEIYKPIYAKAGSRGAEVLQHARIAGGNPSRHSRNPNPLYKGTGNEDNTENSDGGAFNPGSGASYRFRERMRNIMSQLDVSSQRVLINLMIAGPNDHHDSEELVEETFDYDPPGPSAAAFREGIRLLRSRQIIGQTPLYSDPTSVVSWSGMVG